MQICGVYMNEYSFLSNGYDLLDKVWFSDKGKNPRDVIKSLIPNEECTVLDMCCGTFSNGLFLALQNSKNHVVGLDRSESMLREAKAKVDDAQLQNVELIYGDATKTGFCEGSFDYVILGLVLHECTADLWTSILGEVRRVLKPDGKLIVLEWDKQSSVGRKIKFAPLYAAEIMGNYTYFKQFFYGDRQAFFLKHGFQAIKSIACNYTYVMMLGKDRAR